MPVVNWINLPLNVELSSALDELVYEYNKIYLERARRAIAANTPAELEEAKLRLRRPTRLSVALGLLAHALRRDGLTPARMAELLADAPPPARPDLKRRAEFHATTAVMCKPRRARRPRAAA